VSFKDQDLKILETVYGDKAKSHFDRGLNDNKLNQSTVDYFVNIKKTEEAPKVVIDDKSKLFDLKRNFWNMFLENKVSSVHDYIDHLDKNGLDFQKFTVIDHKA